MITYQLNTPQEFKEELIQLLDIFEFNQRTDRRYEFKTIHFKDQHNNKVPIEQALIKIQYVINMLHTSKMLIDDSPNQLLIPMFGHEELFLPMYALMKKHGQASWNITWDDILNRPFRMNIERCYDLLSFVSILTGKNIDGLGSLYSACIA